jgi:nitroimidazol reductase NimA-like FMN-containing flavoprotein (pyridoxamine 5'-phosphate oxidase superfamily)
VLIRVLTTAECRDVLARARHGHLACARAGQPYVVPVSIHPDLDDNRVYSFSTVGRKIRWMRENPKVCLEVAEVVGRLHWTTVLAFGRYEEIPGAGPGEARRQRAHDLLSRQPQFWLPAAAKLSTGEQNPLGVVYCIRISRLTGRRVERRRDQASSSKP